MYIVTMFDLPTSTKEERKSAQVFRIKLLKHGFSMLQFSVYYRVCLNIPQYNKYIEYIKKDLPKFGNIRIFSFTDDQFLRHICIDESTERKELVLDTIIQL